MMKLNKLFKYTGIVAIVISGVWLFASCDSMTSTHEKFLDEEETVYRGKADSIFVRSGKNRAMVYWVLDSDANITRSRVYWNEGQDSLEVDVLRTEETDTLSVEVRDLEEGPYVFEVKNFDDQGNSSLPISASARVYGPTYENGLLNRPISSAVAGWESGGSASLRWGAADLSAVGVEVTYTNNDDASQTIIIPVDEESTELPGYKTETPIEYQTMYLPEETAIDTFYADTDTAGVIYEMPLRNTGFPVEYSEWDGDRWGMPSEWVTNDAVKIHDGYGGYDGYNGGGYFSMESWGGQPDIVNGKIHQSITLPAGTYSYEANFDEDGTAIAVDAEDGDTAYVAIAQGNMLPDVWDIESSAMEYSEFEDIVELRFTLDQEQELTFGFAASFRGGSQAFRCHSVRLYKLE